MKKYVYAIAGVIVLAQFIRPSKIAEPLDNAVDLIAVTKPSAEIADVLRTSCYDCHSGQPRYPWYASITPVNWWINQHIKEGREHFDATTWGTVENWSRDHQAKEGVEMMDQKEMPLKSYLWQHADAKLSDSQYQQLSDWFQGLRDGSWDVEKARRKAAGELN
ncbi:MAG: heme-binding domain-containing protein [Bacteroidetes bacterium]|nr:heme-binding domain-containing protein [Bacteroidota bacterium]